MFETFCFLSAICLGFYVVEVKFSGAKFILLLLFLYDIGFLILLVIIVEMFFIPNMLRNRIWVF